MDGEVKENVIPINIHEEVKRSFLDYAMSVIVSRALPDVRDGLKPVHRRILYAMNEMGITPDKPYRKAARIVGEVLGKYHPHGDLSVYDALVRMAQDFSTRYPLVDGHGNFGSLDGDSAAAMRYTEARMSSLAMEMLNNIKKETVDFVPNFDESLEEPSVLPSRFPNLLVNGSAGIAVGMATNIPPHNLGEVIDAIVFLVDHPDAHIFEIMHFIKGPDFPTGAVIAGKEGIRQAYLTGRGIIKVQGEVVVETSKKQRDVIVIKEIPYQQNKARLVEKIAELIKEKRIEGIADMRDESNRLGVRIVMELRSGVNPHILINQLNRFSPLQQSFGIIMLALVNGEPRVLNLKEMLHYYIEHQKDIIIRRTRFDLKKAEERAHIVEGLRIALSNLDEIIKLIRAARDVPAARKELVDRFDLSMVQAQAILDMRLQKLTGLEREKLEEEYRELQTNIARFKEILGDERLVLKIIKDELRAIKKKHGDKRRTKIIEAREFDETDYIVDEDVVITLTQKGYIKRMPLDYYKNQRRGGKGIIGAKTQDKDYVIQMHTCSTHSMLLCFTNKGRVYHIKTYEIPEARRRSRGTAMVNLLPFQGGEYITTIMPIQDFQKDQFLLMVTARGYAKRTSIKAFSRARKSGLIALALARDDELVSVILTEGEERVIIGADSGHFILFKQEDVRAMGRTARGVIGMRLNPGASVIGADIIRDEDLYTILITSKGFGKRVSLKEMRVQKRGGKGVFVIKTDAERGELTSFKLITGKEEFIVGTAKGIILRLNARGIPVQKRYSRGVILMRVDMDDHVIILTDID